MTFQVVDDVHDVKQSLDSIQTTLHVHVLDRGILPKIKNNLAENGKRLRISLEVDGNVVFFN